MGNPNGMAPNPGESYSIASRLVCAKCWREPAIKSATGSDIITIVVSCHGEIETKVITKKDLVFTQKFFEGPS